MFRKLFANTIVTVLAFGFTAFVSFLLVPLIVGRYGLAEFGLIMLARIMLPTGALGIFDFGYSEVATQIVATAREGGDWRRAGRDLTVLAMVSITIGLIVAAVMVLFAPGLAVAFNAPVEHRSSFGEIILVSGLSFAVFLPGMMLDGIVKGFEAFKPLRTVEVICSVGYGIAAVAVIFARFDYVWVAYVYIVSMLARSSLLGVLSIRRFKEVGLRLRWPDDASRAYVGRRCRLFAGSKLLGASETQAAPFLIGALIGPAAVGLYDISIRFPRFLKTLLAMMNTAVLPLAARLDAAGKKEDLSRLGSTGMLAVAIVAFPVCVWGATFSQPVLRLWLGNDFAHLWFWQSIMFVVPMFNAVASFGSTALLGRPHVIARMNVIMIGQLILQFSIGIAFKSIYGGEAFVLGQAIAFMAVFPLQLQVIAREKGLPWKSFGRLAGVLAGQLVLMVACFLLELPDLASSVVKLATAFVLWMLIAYSVIWYLVLKVGERVQILEALPIGKLRDLTFLGGAGKGK